MPAPLVSTPFASSDQKTSDMLLDNVKLKDISFESKSRMRKNRFTFLHAIFLISYSIAWMALIRPQRLSKPYGLNLISSPAREAVKYERVIFENEVDGVNAFLGEPSPETDAAWSSILKYRNVAIPKADLDATGRQSIALSDDSDRVVINLDVFHSLHCLNYIRESIFYEYYKSKISKTVERSHIGHCIADLVSALKCHADISMQTYRWKQGRLLPWPQFDIEHECRNWESIMEWSKERSVDLQGPILQHPELGTVYPTN